MAATAATAATATVQRGGPSPLAAVARAAPAGGQRLGELRLWGRRGWSALPLTVFSCALGFGLYWVATQEGWLAAGWGPAVATVLLYLAGVLAVVQGLSWVIGGVEARAIRGIERDRPGGP